MIDSPIKLRLNCSMLHLMSEHAFTIINVNWLVRDLKGNCQPNGSKSLEVQGQFRNGKKKKKMEKKRKRQCQSKKKLYLHCEH